MSISDLIKDDVPDHTSSLNDFRIPTKFGLIVDRYNELRNQKWHRTPSEDELDYMSKPLKFRW